MRHRVVTRTRLLKKNTAYEAESIETMLSRRMEGEKVETTGKELVYTLRKDGVLAEGNIRTPRLEHAMLGKDMEARLILAKRGEYDAKKSEKIRNEQVEKWRAEAESAKASQSTQGSGGESI